MSSKKQYPNNLRHSFTTRLLYSLMPATWYAKKDVSVHGLLEALANDIASLFETGISIEVSQIVYFLYYMHIAYICTIGVAGGKLLDFPVQVNGQLQRYYVGFTGTKGDWPWLRKSYALRSGFTSKRICHICSGLDPYNVSVHMFWLYISLGMLGMFALCSYFTEPRSGGMWRLQARPEIGGMQEMWRAPSNWAMYH